MDKFWVVAKREYLERVRSRWFIVMTLLVPVLISGTFLVPVYVSAKAAGSSSVRNVAILDATTAQLGERIADVLAADSSAMRRGGPAPTRLRVRTVAVSGLAAAEDSLAREVMRPNALTGFVVVDDSTLSGARARYAGRNASSLPEVDKLRSAIRQAVMAIRLEREGVRASTIAELNKLPLRMPTQRIDERGRGSSGQAGFFLGIGIGVLLLMSIIFHGQQVLRGVLEEKTSRVAEIVISSVKPETLLAGKVAGNGAVGLTQQLLWIAMSAYLINSVAPILLRNAIPDATAANAASASSLGAGLTFGGLTVALFVAVLLYFLLGFIFYASLLAAAGAMVNSEQDAQQAAMPVTFMLIGTWLFVNSVLLNPSGRIAIVLSWLPFSSPIVMPMRVGLSSVPWFHVAGSLLVCALGCVAAVWLAARIYRVGMLMYGKRPSIAEVVRWVRYA